MPKLKGKEVKDYVFGECLVEFEEGSEIAQALKGGKMRLIVYGISNNLVDPKNFPIYNEQIVANLQKIYPAYYEIVRSQNFLYMIFEELKKPSINPSSYPEVQKFANELQKLLVKTPCKITASQIFTKVNILGELCIIPAYTKNWQKSNNMYTKFYNKSVLAELFCEVVKPKDKQKATATFIDTIETNGFFKSLLPFLNLNQTPSKNQPEKNSKFNQPLHKQKSNVLAKQQHEPEHHHVTKSSANKILKESEEEYPQIDQKQYEQLMNYVHVNPSLKQEAGQAFIRQSHRNRQEEASNQITEIVNNVNTSIFSVAHCKSKDGKSKVEIKLNKKKLQISEFEVHFETDYAVFGLLKNTIRSYLEKYKQGFAGIIAAYLLTLIGILRKLRIYTDLSSGVDIYEIGGEVQKMNFSKYTNVIKKELAKEARALANLKNIIQNANMPYKTYEALMPYLEEDLEKIDLETTQNFCFFYMTILIRMSKEKSYHDILALEVMYVLINPQYAIVYSQEDMPKQWDGKYYELKKLLISTLVPKWEV